MVLLISSKSEGVKIRFRMIASKNKLKINLFPTFSLDLEKKQLSFDLLIPKLRIDATYSLKGNILLLPIVGSGAVAMTMKDVKSSVYTKISIRKKPEVCILS